MSKGEDSCSSAKNPRMVTTDIDKGVLDLEEWNRRWKVDESHWHTNNVDPMLIKYEDKVFGGKEKSKVFVPLCGKSPDMKWMYDKGHTVIGVEISQQGCEEFFKESSIDYKTEDHKNGQILKSVDNRITLYAWDIFMVTRELVGETDVIWDSRSLVALNREDLSQYAELLLSLMGPGTRQLLLTLEYDQSVHPGPPHSTPDSKVKKLYESTCDIELLETVDKTAPDDSNLTEEELEEKKRKEEEEMKPHLGKVVMPSRFNLRKSKYWYLHAYFIQRKKVPEADDK